MHDNKFKNQKAKLDVRSWTPARGAMIECKPYTGLVLTCKCNDRVQAIHECEYRVPDTGSRCNDRVQAAGLRLDTHTHTHRVQAAGHRLDTHTHTHTHVQAAGLRLDTQRECKLPDAGSTHTHTHTFKRDPETECVQRTARTTPYARKLIGLAGLIGLIFAARLSEVAAVLTFFIHCK